jgi:metal-responsive CopG/Arc/MetJ family transcriptional regulator
MAKVKLGIAVDEDFTGEVDELVDECDDLGASRSEIIEAILTAYVRSDSDHAVQVRELITCRRKGTL